MHEASPQLSTIAPAPAPVRAVDGVRRRTRALEASLYRGLLGWRAGLPWLALVAAPAGAVGGPAPAAVWGPLAAWTLLTTPWAWNRLRWCRRLPAPVVAEAAALALLLALGWGGRGWTALQAAVPLVLCALFVSARASAVAGAGLVAAAGAGAGAAALWPEAPLPPPGGWLAAALLHGATAIVLPLFSRLVRDVDDLARGERRARTDLVAARRARVRRAVRAGMNRRIAGRLDRRTRDLACHAAGAVGAGRDDAGLVAACAAIEEAVRELAGAAPPSPCEGGSILGELERAARSIETLMAVPVTISRPADLPDEPLPVAVEPFRRLVGEALTNAAKHGRGGIAVSIRREDAALVVEIANDAERPPAPRPGRIGLASMREDADLIGADHWVGHRDGRAVVGIGLPTGRAGIAELDPVGQPGALRELVGRRRAECEGAVARARLAVALVTAVLWAAEDGPGHAGVEALTALALVGTSVAVAVGRRLGVGDGQRRALVLADLVLLATEVALTGGLGSPWLPLACTWLAGGALVAGPQATASGAGLVAAAAVAGGGLAGALAPVPAALALAAAAAGAIALSAAFDRMREAAAAYEATAELLADEERTSAEADARAEIRRDLHHRLWQDLPRALGGLAAVGAPADPAALAVVERRLEQALRLVRVTMERLAPHDQGLRSRAQSTQVPAGSSGAARSGIVAA